MAGEIETAEQPLDEVDPSSMDVGAPPNDPAVFDSGNSKYLSESYRLAAGAGYVLATGVCGIVLVAISSSLQDLAREIGTSSLKVKKQFLRLFPPSTTLQYSRIQRIYTEHQQPNSNDY